MWTALPVVCAALVLSATPVETTFAEVAPWLPEGVSLVRSRGRDRAVVLIHGLHLHPISSSSVPRPGFAGWQAHDSLLVTALSREADVYAFSYGQNMAVEDVADLPGLVDNVAALRHLGYREIVLVGFSAGGLVVRDFVEDHPLAGVTKVIQVCAPNNGSSWASCKVAVRSNQEPFLASLTKKGRQVCLKARRAKQIPETVQFVCVVGTGMGNGDGVVNTRSQWPDDLQEQGIPVVPVRTLHLLMMHSHEGVQTVAELVRRDVPRWDAARVAAARKQLHEP